MGRIQGVFLAEARLIAPELPALVNDLDYCPPQRLIPYRVSPIIHELRKLARFTSNQGPYPTLTGDPIEENAGKFEEVEKRICSAGHGGRIGGMEEGVKGAPCCGLNRGVVSLGIEGDVLAGRGVEDLPSETFLFNATGLSGGDDCENGYISLTGSEVFLLSHAGGRGVPVVRPEDKHQPVRSPHLIEACLLR
ncbi:MAG TPA: hypothetical protein VFW71_07285 [Actinomycetota bacterium]|nr:hypothetical protein [Actinomycetota bacterium]